MNSCTLNYFNGFYLKYSINRFDAIGQLCDWDLSSHPNFDLPRTQSIYHTIMDIQPAFGFYHSAGILFQMPSFEYIFTEQGLCSTFNSIKSDHIYTDE